MKKTEEMQELEILLNEINEMDKSLKEFLKLNKIK